MMANQKMAEQKKRKKISVRNKLLMPIIGEYIYNRLTWNGNDNHTDDSK